MASPAAPLVDYGEVQLQLKAASANNYDALALSGLAVVVASIAALASLQTVIGTGWWAPIIPLALAALQCLTCMTGDGIDVGKPLATIVVENEGSTEEQVSGALIAELTVALQNLDRLIEAKRVHLTNALVWVGITAILSAALYPNV